VSPAPTSPLCFVLMPFGTKIDPVSGVAIDFDKIYEEAIRLGVEAAGMDPIRADEERTGGIIHKAMFERLVLCDYAIADLTTGNANVFYELGVRHAARPATTLAIFASDQKIPFDLSFLRALPYRLGDGGRFGAEEAEELRGALTRRLLELKRLQDQHEGKDSPLFQLLADDRMPDVSRLKTDVFPGAGRVRRRDQAAAGAGQRPAQRAGGARGRGVARSRPRRGRGRGAGRPLPQLPRAAGLERHDRPA
jgi:hypothetical protein